MFDAFNKRKIEELEGDIQTLYHYIEHLQAEIKGSKTFESFVRNQEERADSCRAIHQGHHYRPVPEKKYEDISTKSVVELILKKMGLKVGYTPGRVVTEHIMPEFKLCKRE